MGSTADTTNPGQGGDRMGLDTVELVIEVEEMFGIAIPDADAESIATVGALHRYIVAKLGLDASPRPGSRCPSQAAFHRLRRALVEGLGVERSRVRPASPMETLIAARRRKAAWAHLERALGFPLPRLVRPAGLVNGLTVWVMVAVLAIAIFESSVRVPVEGVAVSILGLGIALTALAAWLTVPFATAKPPACATVRDAVGVALFRDPSAIRDDIGPDAVWTVLRTIIVEQLGVRPEDLVEDASFVDDLGAG
jgi:acyl carrier protein